LGTMVGDLSALNILLMLEVSDLWIDLVGWIWVMVLVLWHILHLRC